MSLVLSRRAAASTAAPRCPAKARPHSSWSLGGTGCRGTASPVVSRLGTDDPEGRQPPPGSWGRTEGSLSREHPRAGRRAGRGRDGQAGGMKPQDQAAGGHKAK